MNILVISNDKELIQIIEESNKSIDKNLIVKSEFSDAIEILSNVCTISSSVVFIDDDLVKPNTVKILKSIRDVKPTLKIVFFTSDSSIELGREISPIGIHFYSIKPISKKECEELINSFDKGDF